MQRKPSEPARSALRDAAYRHADHLELCEQSIAATKSGDATAGASLYARALNAEEHALAALQRYDEARKCPPAASKRRRARRVLTRSEKIGRAVRRIRCEKNYLPQEQEGVLTP